MLVRQPSRWGRVAAVDWSAHAERVVLTAVLGIAALISYTHLREVWVHSGAPWEALGPLLVDGLFAAAWLRMRRRRRDGVPVGWLAWTALGLALAGTLAGNLAAAWVTGHRDPLALVVAAVPAVAFALVWELVTGHGRKPLITRPGPPSPPVPARPIAEPLSAEAAETLTAAIGVPVWPRSRLGLLPTAVYRLFDETDRLLYVGITCDLALRLADHKLCKPWWSVVVRVEVEMFSSRAEALAEERDAIATEVPLHNRLPGSRTDLGVAKAIAEDARQGPIGSAKHLVETGVVGPALEQEEPAVDQVRRDEHYEAVQRLADDLGQRPTRQAVRDLTGVGATRADRLRNAVVVRTADDLVRTGPEGPA